MRNSSNLGFITTLLIGSIALGCGIVSAQAAEREFLLEKRYLNLPVQNDAPWQVINLNIDGKTVRTMDVRLATDEPDFWAFLDVGMFKGEKGVLIVKKSAADTSGFKMIYQDDRLKEEDTTYTEKLRPQFHFTARRGWIQDPVGLVFYDGEYHMFPLHCPYGQHEMAHHWGHAVSKDLIHWEEIQTAMFPDELGEMYSGSAVVDHNNSSGFQTGEE